MISFFLKNGLHSRKIIAMLVLGGVPVAASILLALGQGLLENHDVMVSGLFSSIYIFLYLHFLLPLTAAFAGTSLISDEVEDGTLPYLVVQPVPKYKIMLGKWIANYITTAAILTASLILTYTFLMLPGGLGQWIDEISKALDGIFVLLLGLAVYLSLFAVFGGMLKKPVLSALLFAFGWENLVAFFPGNVKFLTVIHYLHVLGPGIRQKGLFGLSIPVKQISDGLAVFILFLILAVSLAIFLSVLYVREYRLSQE